MSEYKQITIDAAKKMMDEEKNCLIVDVRTDGEYESGYIPGAINVPLETIGTKEPAKLPKKDQTLLIYCRSGVRSKMAAEKLARLGYSNVYEFGGILDWDGDVEVDY